MLLTEGYTAEITEINVTFDDQPPVLTTTIFGWITVLQRTGYIDWNKPWSD